MQSRKPRLSFRTTLPDGFRYEKVIVLVAFDRFSYFREVVRAIIGAEGSDDYTLIIAVDRPINSTSNNAWQHLVQFSQDLSTLAKLQNIPIKDVIVSVSDTNLGVWKNKKRAVEMGFRVSDFVVVLEDDIVLETDALRWFEWHIDSGFAFQNPRIALATCWSNLFQYDNRPVEPYDIFLVNEFGLLDKYYTRSWATPWGWAMWKRTWEVVGEAWSGQDINLGRMIQAQQWEETLPLVARCNNIGSFGAHKQGTTHGHIHKRSITSGYFPAIQKCGYQNINGSLRKQDFQSTFELINNAISSGIFERKADYSQLDLNLSVHDLSTLFENRESSC